MVFDDGLMAFAAAAASSSSSSSSSFLWYLLLELKLDFHATKFGERIGESLKIVGCFWTNLAASIVIRLYQSKYRDRLDFKK